MQRTYRVWTLAEKRAAVDRMDGCRHAQLARELSIDKRLLYSWRNRRRLHSALDYRSPVAFEQSLRTTSAAGPTARMSPMHRNKPGRSRHDTSPAHRSTAHRCDEFQPRNPRRVALQAELASASPAIPSCNINSRSPSKTQRTANRAFAACLTRGGHSTRQIRLSSPQTAYHPQSKENKHGSLVCVNQLD